MPTTSTTTAGKNPASGRPRYPLDVSFEPMCAQSGLPFTIMRFASMPAELILRREHGWQYLGRMFWVQVALCLGVLWFKAMPYLAAGYLPNSLLAWLAFAYLVRGAWVQFRIIMRGKWGADYLVPGYSGGESYLRRFFTTKGENKEEREACAEQIERALRMFAEPAIVAAALYIASVILHVGWLWYVVPVSMFLKQAWEWKFTRARVQTAMTKKREVDVLQDITHADTGAKNGGGDEEIPVVLPAALPYSGELFKLAQMQSRMPQSLQKLMGVKPALHVVKGDESVA